jgi:flagellar protein FlaJ
MLEKICISTFGKLVRPYLEYFEELKFKLKQADMKYSVHGYVSILLFVSFVVFVAALFVSMFLLFVFMGFQFYAVTTAIIIATWASGGSFFLGYYYPTMKSSNFRNRLEKELPFAVIYMSTAASSEINVEDLFKIMSLRKDIAGNECKRIYNGMHMLGMDPLTSLTKAANRTPSPKFAELLWGLISVVEQGGSLKNYLDDKSKEFMGHYRRSLADYSKQISFYTEIYITLIIVGTLFFIVLSSIMSPLIGGDILIMQTFLVFVFIPLISMGFIVLLKGIYPS